MSWLEVHIFAQYKVGHLISIRLWRYSSSSSSLCCSWQTPWKTRSSTSWPWTSWVGYSNCTHYVTNHNIKTHTAEHMGENKHRPHHELGVSFGQGVGHKPHGLQMVNDSMEELGLEKKINGPMLIVKRQKNQGFQGPCENLQGSEHVSSFKAHVGCLFWQNPIINLSILWFKRTERTLDICTSNHRSFQISYWLYF